MNEVAVYVLCGAQGGAVEAESVTVPENSTFERIRELVAHHYRVSVQAVDILRGTADGGAARVRARSIQQVPAPDERVICHLLGQNLLHLQAAMAANGGINGNTNKRRWEIPPKPIIMKQDMEGYSVPICLSELIDNAIRADAREVTVQCGKDKNNPDVIKSLRCSDTGCGMSVKLARDFMRLAHTDSGLVYGFREPKKPLSAAQYFTKQLSRHGKGALALLYFGNKITIETKTRDILPVEVEMDYAGWLREYNETENCKYYIDVTDFILREEGDDDEHYTDITISDLKSVLIPQLSDDGKLQDWANQIADIYYFHINGFPERLWSSMPAVLRPNTPPAAAAGGRPRGGIKLNIFNRVVGDSAVSAYISRFMQLQQQHGHDKLKPFWLPIRWCPPGLSPDDVPTDVKASEGFSAEGGGPAGKLDGVYRDFLLLLLYFPTNNGSRTKPIVQMSSTDMHLFPIWSGRLMPEADCVRVMPAFIDEARKGKDGEHKLTNTRLGGFLFCSPEVYTTNHKTNFQDPAFKRVMQLGSEEGHPGYQDLWVWYDGWQEPNRATYVLQDHFRRYWRALEQEGELIDPRMDPLTGTRKANKYRFANRDVVEAGDLVRLRSIEELQKIEVAGAKTTTAAAAAAAAAGTGQAGGGRSGGRRGGGNRAQRTLTDSEYPDNYRVVVEFLETGSDSTGHQVVLKHWSPPWSPADHPVLDSTRQVGVVARLSPDESTHLQSQWKALAPHHLAWLDAARKQIAENHTQPPGVPGSGTMASAQVPDSLTVALATQSGQLSRVDKGRWGGHMQLKNLSCDFTMARNGEQIMRKNIKYVAANNGFLVMGLGDFAKDAGNYVLKFAPMKSWIPGPLTCSFKVVESIATKLEAAWSHDDMVPKVQLEQILPDLIISTRNQDETVAMLPFANVNDPIPRDVLKITLRPSDPQQHGSTIKYSSGVSHLTNDRTAIRVHGWRLQSQPLGDKQHPVMQLHTLVNVELILTAYGGGRLVLQPGQQPNLHLLSGGPAKIISDVESSPNNPMSSTRGSKVLLTKLCVVDAPENPVHMDTRHYSACIYFKPQNAAAPSRASEDPAAAAAAGSSAAAAAGRRRKSGVVAPYYKCKLDGNVLDCEQPLRWMGAPEKCVTAVVAIFRRATLPDNPSTQKPAISLELYYRMDKMHLVPEHALIDRFSADVSVDHKQYLSARWNLRARAGRDQQQDRSSTSVEAEAYELNTWDNCPTDLLAPNVAEAAVPEGLKQRLQAGYELRRDVLSGRTVDLFITPNGTLLPSTQPSAVTRVLPRSLVDHWNRLQKTGCDRVFDVVFVVSHTQERLERIVIKVCEEKDAWDEDFRGQVKLAVEANGQRHPVYPEDPILEITGGQLTLPNIQINREWFHTLNRGTVKLLLLDLEDVLQQQQQQQQDDQQQQQQVQLQQAKELGCIYVRLASHAERLQVVPAGGVFQGVHVTGRFGNETEPEKRLLLSQEIPSSASTAASSSSSSLGAWAPWRTQKPGLAAPATSGRSAARGAAAGGDLAAVQHRGLSIDDPIRVRLGEPVVLHFVALDLVGCPVAVTADQADGLRDRGVTVVPDQLPSPTTAAGAAAVPFSVTAGSWHFASPQGTQQQQQLPPGHLGGLLVNSVTVTMLSGVGRAKICLALQGSAAEPAVYELPVIVEAGPVAVDGLWLKQVVFEQPAAAAAQIQQQQPQLEGVLMDRHTWQMLPKVKQDPAAAAAAGDLDGNFNRAGEGMRVQIKPDPEAAAQQQQQQPPGAAAAAAPPPPPEVIDLLDTASEDEGQDVHDDQDEVMIVSDQEQAETLEIDLIGNDQQQQQQQRQQQPGVPTQQQRQQSQYARLLESLDRDKAALLYCLEVTEGTTVRATIQLRDADQHEVCECKSGKLLLLHHEGWQQPTAGQQQQQREAVRVAGPLDVQQGRAELTIDLGVGDSCLGSQLFEITPAAAAAAGAGSSNSTGELQKVLPVLLLLDVKPGNLPSKLELISDLRSDGWSNVVSLAEALAAAVPAVTLDQIRSQISDPDQILGPCNLGPETTNSPGGHVLALPLIDHAAAAEDPGGSSSSGAAAVPGFCIMIHSRDQEALQPSALQQLKVSLHRWNPAAAAAGGSSRQQQQQQLSWVEVQGSVTRISAKLRCLDLPLQQQQQGAPGEDPAAPGEGDAAAAAAAVADPVAVFDVEPGLFRLPEEAGLYKLQASYSAAAGALQVPDLDIGPILLLPALPSKLVNLTLQRQQQLLPTSPARRGRVRGKMLSSRAATAEVPVAVAVAAEVISPDDLKSKVLSAVDLQLQDKWGNPWRAAAAALAAAAAVKAGSVGAPLQQQQQRQGTPGIGTDPVAGILPTPFRGLLQAIEADSVNPPPPQQQQQQDELNERPAKRPRTANRQQQQCQHWQLQLAVVSVPSERSARASRDGSSAWQQQQQQTVFRETYSFDADGICEIQQQSLQQLGITAAGDYKVYASAVSSSAATAAAGSSNGRVSGAEVPPVLLAHYRVARSVNRVALEQQKTDMQARIHLLQSTVQDAQKQQQRAAAVLEHLESRTQHMADQRAAAIQQQQLQQQQQAAVQGYSPENAPPALLTQTFQPNGPILGPQIMLHPRSVRPAANGGWIAAPAAANTVDHELFSVDPNWIRLHETGDLLGPMICLGSVERSDVARVLSAYMGQDLRVQITRTREASQALRYRGQRVQCYNLGQPELVSRFTYVPHQQRQQQQAAGNSWMVWHPQLLLQPTGQLANVLRAAGVQWDAYDPKIGFIGFAQNLIRLSQQQLGLRIAVHATIDCYGNLRFDRQAAPLQLGLRETLWHFKLSNLLIFESEQHIDGFRQRLYQANRTLPGFVRVIGLDGSTYNVKTGMENYRLNLPAPNSGALLFSGVADGPEVLPVSQEDYQATGGPLDLRLRYYMNVSWQAHRAHQEVEALRQQNNQLQQQIRQAKAELKDAEKALEAANTKQQREWPGCRKQLQQLDEELQDD